MIKRTTSIHIFHGEIFGKVQYHYTRGRTRISVIKLKMPWSTPRWEVYGGKFTCPKHFKRLKDAEAEIERRYHTTIQRTHWSHGSGRGGL